MAINLHIWPLICILMNIAYHLSLKTDPILFTDVHFIDKDILVVNFYKRKQLHIVAKEAIWRPFCLCKLDGQELNILLGNRVYQIQHTQIRLKSLVPRFYPKMPLDSYRAPFFQKSHSSIILF